MDFFFVVVIITSYRVSKFSVNCSAPILQRVRRYYKNNDPAIYNSILPNYSILLTREFRFTILPVIGVIVLYLKLLAGSLRSI